MLEHAGSCNFALTLLKLSGKFTQSRLQSWKAASSSADGGRGRHGAFRGGASDTYGDDAVRGFPMGTLSLGRPMKPLEPGSGMAVWSPRRPWASLVPVETTRRPAMLAAGGSRCECRPSP